MQRSGPSHLMRIGRRIEAPAEHCLAAQSVERTLPLGLEVGVEHQRSVGLDHQPGIVLHLAVELPGRPVGMPERQPGLLGPAAAGHVLQDLERCGKRHAAIDQQSLRSEEHTSELQSLAYLVCRLLLEKKKYLQYAA